VCEPRLLRDARSVSRTLELLAVVTNDLAEHSPELRRRPEWRTLRQALGYGWSVAVAASPAAALPVFERMGESEDVDVHWIVRENRKKSRFEKAVRSIPASAPQAAAVIRP